MVFEYISTELMYQDSSKEIIKEIESLIPLISNKRYKLSLLGTNNLAYSITNELLFPFKKGKLSRLRRFVLGKFRKILIQQKKILSSFNGVWSGDLIIRSIGLMGQRRSEIPWSFLNSKLEGKMKILDVGSGNSLFPIYLARKGHEVYAIDTDEILMKRVGPQMARWCGTKVNYVLGDGAKIQFDDNTFDRVFCISTLEHIEEEIIDGKICNFHKNSLDVKAIDEMFRVLKPNGLLILTVDWSENPNDRRSYRIDDISNRLLKKYQENLVENKKPQVDWEKVKHKHLDAWNAFPLEEGNVIESWAMGIVIKK